MRGPAIALASVAGLAGLGLLRRGGGTWGSRATRRLTLVDVERAIRADGEAEGSPPSLLDKIPVPGVTVHPRSEWPTGIRTRTGTYGACPGDLHTTQGRVYADLVAKKEREIRDMLRMTPNQRAALHGCDWVPAEHAGMPGVSVVRVRGRWWVYDGHHGLAAYRHLGIEPIVWRATLAANGDPIAAPRLFARRAGSRSEWAELGRAGLPVGHTPSIKKLVHVVSLRELATLWRNREGGASGALVAWVEIALGAGPPYREGIPIDDVLDRMSDWAWGESDAIAVERCHEELVLLAKHFNRLSFPLTVYRGLEVHPRTIVDVQEPGDHWTPNRAVALAFATGRHQSSHRERTGDRGGEPVLLSGTISGPHAIRWRETFNGYFDYTVDHADDPEVAEQQVATSLVRDVQIIPITTRKPSKKRAGSCTAIQIPATLYHATLARKADAIERAGLQPSTPATSLWFDQASGFVYVAGTPSAAASFVEAYLEAIGELNGETDKDEIAVFAIDTSKTDAGLWQKDPFNEYPKIVSLRYPVVIPPRALSRVPPGKAGSRTIRAKAQRFDAMIGDTGAILPRIPLWPAVQRHLKNDLQFETDSDYGTTFSDMVVEALDTLKRRQPEARNTPASGRAPTRQNAEILAWEWIQGRYDDFVASAARFTDPLVLYREVTAKRHADIRIDGLGAFWSWDPEAAEAHWSRGGEHWLLVASVSARYVDWMATATANVTMPYEREITLIPGSPVLLLRIRNDAGVTVVDEWGTA
jgi:hypothetical protein